MRARRATLAVSAAGLALFTSAASAAEIQWAKTFDQAMAKAKASNKLVMADFYTDW